MIQRIQTLYLVLGALATGSVYCLDQVWTGPAAVASPWFTPVSLGLSGLAVAGAVLAVFLFKDRTRQKLVVSVVRIVAAVSLVAVVFGEYLGATLPLFQVDGSALEKWTSIVAPIIGIVFFSLARRGIERDIDLIASVDRLR